MSSCVNSLTALLLIWASCGVVSSEETLVEGTGLRAVYYGDANWTNAQVSRIDPTIDYFWGGSAPASGVPSDNFSVRWAGYLLAPVSGSYTFTAIADDTAEVWIGSKLVIAQGVYTGSGTSGTVMLEAGHYYPIVYSMQEGAGNAGARLLWSYPGQPQGVVPTANLYTDSPVSTSTGNGNGLTVSYFPTADFSGVAVQALDPIVNDVFESRFPGSPLPPDNFSVRWTGSLVPRYSESYVISVTGDDGVRLWVDGVPVIDRWVDQSPTTTSATINLVAGHPSSIRLEYYEHGGGAVARLAWASPSQVSEIIPASQLIDANGRGRGLTGEYFSNKNLEGSPVLKRVDSSVNFDWGSSDPVTAQLSGAKWTARWTGELEAPTTDSYTLAVFSSGGVVVNVGGKTVINDVAQHNLRGASGTVPMIGGKRVPITINYVSGGNIPSVRLWWAALAVYPQVIPSDRLYPQTVDSTAFAVLQPAISRVSPAWFNGTVNRLTAHVAVSQDGNSLPVVRTGANGWYVAGSGRIPAGIVLSPDASTVVRATDGTTAAQQSLVWEPTDLANTYGLDPLVIRAGDSLLVTDTRAIGTMEVDADYHAPAFRVAQSGSSAPGIVVPFLTPGTYVMQGRDARGLLGKINVEVVGVDLQGPIACQITYPRKKSVMVSHPSRVVFTSDDASALAESVNAVNGTSVELILQPLTGAPQALESHLRDEGGPLIARQPIDAFSIRSTAQRRIAIEETLSDGSMRGVAHLIMNPGIPNLDVRLRAFVAGVLFDNGTTVLQVNTSDFDAESADGPLAWEFPYALTRAANNPHGFCHSYSVFQNNVQISY